MPVTGPQGPSKVPGGCRGLRGTSERNVTTRAHPPTCRQAPLDESGPQKPYEPNRSFVFNKNVKPKANFHTAETGFSAPRRPRNLPRAEQMLHDVTPSTRSARWGRAMRPRVFQTFWPAVSHMGHLRAHSRPNGQRFRLHHHRTLQGLWLLRRVLPHARAFSLLRVQFQGISPTTRHSC